MNTTNRTANAWVVDRVAGHYEVVRPRDGWLYQCANTLAEANALARQANEEIGDGKVPCSDRIAGGRMTAPWYASHANLSDLVAYLYEHEDYTVRDVIRLLAKPQNWTSEYEAMRAEEDDERRANEVLRRQEREQMAGEDGL